MKPAELELADMMIDRAIKNRYEGYNIEEYASGCGFGIRDKSYDVILKDGSRFCVDATYDFSTNQVKMAEREYKNYG